MGGFDRGFRCAALALLGLVSASFAASGAPAISASSVPCLPLSGWVRDSVDKLVRTAHVGYQRKDPYKYNVALEEVVNSAKRCGYDHSTDLVSEFPEFVEYLDEAGYAVRPGHELGFNVSDRQYFAETGRWVTLPEYLLDKRFVRDVSRAETLWRAKIYLTKLNSTRSANSQLIFFSYTSRHIGTPDNNDSYRRLLVVVPGFDGEPDKWVQFGVTDPGARRLTRNISVVSAVPRGDGSYDAYFRDMFRTYGRDGSVTIRGRLELGEGEDNCVACHKSGVLPIFPVAGSVGRGEEDRVAAVNARFRGYGAPRFGGYIDPSKFGPGLGFGTTEKRHVRFGPAFSETVVAHAMVCDRCHTPEKLGYLNWPMDRVIVASFVNAGWMPRDARLSSAHRAELYEKLVREYFDVSDTNPGIMKSWLLGKMR